MKRFFQFLMDRIRGFLKETTAKLTQSGPVMALKEKRRELSEKLIGKVRDRLTQNETYIRLKETGIKLDEIFKENHLMVRLVLALCCALLSLSGVFILIYAARADTDLTTYFRAAAEGAPKNFAGDAFSFCFSHSIYLLALIPAFFAAYYYQFGRLKSRLEGMFASAFFALYLVVPLAMTKSGNREIFFPCSILLYYPGLLMLCSVCVRFLYQALDWRTEKCYSLPLTSPNSELRLFGGTVFAIFLLWVPILITCYPGSLDYNTLLLLKEYLGLRKRDAANPILLTFLYGGLYDFGRTIMDETKGIALLLVFQTVLCAISMAWATVKVYKYTRSWIWYVVTLLFYAAVPVWPGAVQTILKETTIAALYLMFCIQYLECLRKEEIGRSDFILLTVYGALCAASRNVLCYITLFLMALLVYRHRKAYLLRCSACLGCVAVICFSIHLALPYLNVAKQREVDQNSMRLQIFGAYIQKYGDEISSDDKKIINETLNYRKVYEEYTPLSAAPMKDLYHGDKNNHQEFWKLYNRLMLKHPLIVPKAIVMDSYRYMDPTYNGGGNRLYMARDDSFLTIEYKYGFPTELNHFWNAWISNPFLSLFLSTGTYGWAAVVLAGYAIRKRSLYTFFGLMTALAPFFGLLFTQDNGPLWYSYPVIAVAPVIAAFTVMMISRSGTREPPPRQKQQTNRRRVNPLVMLEQEEKLMAGSKEGTAK